MKRCYAWLCDFFAGGRVVVADQQRAMWLKLWKNNAPSKILIFAWRVLINKIATRDALSRRGVLRDDADRRCVLCSSEDETIKHIFLDCRVAKKIWQQVCLWLDVPIVEGEDIQAHFMAFGKLIKGKKQKRVKHLIWMAVIWNIWLTRNKVIFKEEATTILVMISGIKDCAWAWFKARQGRTCWVGWSDWYNCPMGCLLSL